MLSLPQRPFRYFPSIGSTMDAARAWAEAGAPDGAVVAADEQTSGRGRQGRSWHTPPGAALAFSLLTRPALAAHRAMRLTMLAGLAAVEGIEWATGLRLDLKWPNDVVFHDERRWWKVGGILTECTFQGDTIEYAVVGLGLNVNVDFSQQVELREIATSLVNLKGQHIDRLAVLRAVVGSFIDHYAGLETDEQLRNAWAARLINLQKNLRVNLNGQIVEGYAEGVDDDGALLLRTADDQLQRLLSGDVTLHDHEPRY